MTVTFDVMRLLLIESVLMADRIHPMFMGSWAVLRLLHFMPYSFVIKQWKAAFGTVTAL